MAVSFELIFPLLRTANLTDFKEVIGPNSDTVSNIT